MQASTCLTPDELARLASGQSSESVVESWTQHVERCAACAEKLETLLAADPLLGAIRGAVSHPVESPVETVNLIARLHRLVSDGGGDRSEEGPDDDDRLEFLEPPRSAGELGRMGDYRILAVVGQGGSSYVFRAEDTRLNRLVAIKLLRESFAGDVHRRLRFEQEARSLARLKHPQIVQAYEVGRLRNRPYIALQYVGGGTLAERMARGPFPPEYSAQCIVGLARAVHYAHANDIAHRDLKPANILLDREVSEPAAGAENPPPESLKIVDFGLARWLDEAGFTQSGDLLGTPAYMAPEATSASHPREVDAIRADVYSLGAIFYEMLAGRPAFFGSGVADVLEQVRRAAPVSPRQVRARVPRDLETICLKCLAKSPGGRYGSAAELADDLERYLQGRPIQARPASVVERLRKWIARRPAPAAALLVLALAATLLLLGAWTYERRLRRALVEARDQADAARAAEQEAERRRDEATLAYRAARDVVRDILQVVEGREFAELPRIGELRRSQLELALEFHERMAAGGGERVETRYEAARARHEAAVMQELLGRGDEARDGFLQAAAEFAQLGAEHPDDPNYALEQARALTRLATTYRLPEQLDAALESGRDAVRILAQRRGQDPGDLASLGQLASAHNALASIYFAARAAPIEDDRKQAYWRRSETHYLESYALAQVLMQAHPDDLAKRRDLAALAANLSVLYQQRYQERRADCHRFHEEALAALAELTRAAPTDFTAVCDMALRRVNWAYVLAGENQIERALDDLASNVDELRTLLAREPNLARARDALYRTWGVRANLLAAVARHAEAAEAWRQLADLGTEQQRPLNRLFRVMSLARTDQHSAAMSEVESLATLPSIAQDPTLAWNLARTCSLALGSARRESSPLPDETRDRYAHACLKLLNQTRERASAAQWKELSAAFPLDPDFSEVRDDAAIRRLFDSNEVP